MASVPIHLGLGSNLGRREAHLEQGLRALRAQGVDVLALSSIYETEPVGGEPQGPYLNLVAKARTALAPDALLRAAREAEARAGRVRTVRNAPRTLDVDILFYGDLVLSRPGLVLPHPRLHERRFVLAPLAEIAPEWRHPRLRLGAAELLRRLPPGQEVRLVSDPDPPRG